MMQLERTTDGRYVKVLSPELRGLIGRVYGEIRERKDSDALFTAQIDQNTLKTTQLENNLNTIMIKVNYATETLEKMFPIESANAYIERNLVISQSLDVHRNAHVSGDVTIGGELSVQNQSFFKSQSNFQDMAVQGVLSSLGTTNLHLLNVDSDSTTHNLTVNNATTLNTLNVTGATNLQGSTTLNQAYIKTAIDADVLKSRTSIQPPLEVSSTMKVVNLNAEFLDGKSATDFAPMSHVGEGGLAHPVATEQQAGFLSPMDLKRLNDLAAGQEVGYTVAVSQEQPAPTRHIRIWLDIADSIDPVANIDGSFTMIVGKTPPDGSDSIRLWLDTADLA